MFENSHQHRWIERKDSNGRPYRACWTCPIIVRPWEPEWVHRAKEHTLPGKIVGGVA